MKQIVFRVPAEHRDYSERSEPILKPYVSTGAGERSRNVDLNQTTVLRLRAFGLRAASLLRTESAATQLTTGKRRVTDPMGEVSR
jgi:hypothetical protein